MRGIRLTVIALPVMLGLLVAAEPATQPADPTPDPTIDWLLSHATTIPSSGPTDGVSEIPATLPSVLHSGDRNSDESRQGVIALSDGRKLAGRISTTLRQPLRVWDAEDKQYQDIPFSLIKSITAKVVWERDEPEWKFKESGSDVKEYSGKTYPARLTDYVVAEDDGTIVTGGVAAPLYLDADGERKIFILHKRDKGEVGQRLGELVYVRQVNFER